MDTVKYEDFAKLDLRIARITAAAPIEGTDKLVVLSLDIGDEQRQIVAGIKKHFPVCEESKSDLIGKLIVIVANLEPRKIRGFESHGMLLAASNGESLQLLTPEHFIETGSKVG